MRVVPVVRFLPVFVRVGRLTSSPCQIEVVQVELEVSHETLRRSAKLDHFPVTFAFSSSGLEVVEVEFRVARLIRELIGIVLLLDAINVAQCQRQIFVGFVELACVFGSVSDVAYFHGRFHRF